VIANRLCAVLTDGQRVSIIGADVLGDRPHRTPPSPFGSGAVDIDRIELVELLEIGE
jgi:hypothetical protein